MSIHVGTYKLLIKNMCSIKQMIAPVETNVETGMDVEDLEPCMKLT